MGDHELINLEKFQSKPNEFKYVSESFTHSHSLYIYLYVFLHGVLLTNLILNVSLYLVMN